ncbi:hypothetical protein QVD17_19056 [Tagetes erecta]|uniref:C2H2-type domain-containing protein n=1 Tax=Tagetes erecta TaxID=13708 RepID=A0AAD8KJ04_TARER|nr:hypothetical protein QVD17_19056 [Tagetes erecta]
MALGSSSVLQRNEVDTGLQGQDIHATQKRRNPRIEYPDAEIIALSPHTLMTKDRFVCEVCLRGFPREQNLELHKRGHNLPWRLRQNTNQNRHARRKLYICPEPSCVHHDPSHALGDLTGIKKHYSRKHGEKTLKCKKCGRMYAVQSDLKAHAKVCGSKEYRCPCGMFFASRETFVAHRVSCETLANGDVSGPSPALTSMGFGSSNASQTSLTLNPFSTHAPIQTNPSITIPKTMSQFGQTSQNNNNIITPSSPFYHLPSLNQDNQYKYNGNADHTSFFTNLNTSTHHNLDIFSGNYGFTTATTPQLSATALLQKASLLGSTWSNNNSSFATSFSSSYANSGYGIATSESNVVPNYFSNGFTSLLNLNADASYNEQEQYQPFGNMGFQESSGTVAFTRDFLGVGGGVDLSSDAPESTFVGRNFI